MAVGKSAVGRDLAKRLRRRFIDIDRVIERAAGLKVRAIFEQKGEAYFRQLEKQTLAEVLRHEGQVVATGGGIVLDDANLELLRERSLVVGLHASTTAILKRVGNSAKRPLLKGGDRRERIDTLLKARAARYAQAHLNVETDELTLSQVVDKIVEFAQRAAGMQTVNVNLGPRSYPIHIGSEILAHAGELLKQAGLRGKVAIVSNPTVAQLYLDVIHNALSQSGYEVLPLLVADGEEHKTLHSLQTIYDGLIAARLERRSCVLALGGGVVGDLAGFAAATYLRGVPYVQVPTTLLAQVDSSVGGKTGVNHAEGKNLIGAFYQPKLVLIDVALLKTLPRRELIAGLAEVIKYGVIEDSALFALLEERIGELIELDVGLLMQTIATCCAIKAEIVEADEREDDSRAVLNFGHTIGHALEAVTGYRQFLHGEAVGIGMVKAAMLSRRQGFLDPGSFERIIQLIKKTGLPTELPAGVSLPGLIEAMEVDKKAAGGKIKFVMCAGIGETRFHALAPSEILAGLGV